MFNEKDMMNSAEQPDRGKEVENKFNEAFNKGDFNEVERILNEEKLEAREKDKLQRRVFQAYYKEENWQGVVRIINATEDPFSQKGRINRFKELAGEKFKEFENQIVFKEIDSSEAKEIVEIKSTLDFRELLKQKDYDTYKWDFEKIFNSFSYLIE